MKRTVLVALVALVLTAASSATVEAQTQTVTITPFDGYSSACPASGETFGTGGRCDLKVEGLPIAEGEDTSDVTQITVEGVAPNGTASTIACGEPVSVDGWAYRCGGYAFLNWNRHFEIWEVWLYPTALKDSTAWEKLRISVNVENEDPVVWEGTQTTGTGLTAGTRQIFHSQGQPRVESNAVEAAAWNQAVCHNGDTNNDGRCTTSDIGFEFTGKWVDESGTEIPWPEPESLIPAWILTACEGDAVSFTNSYGVREGCP